MDQILQIEEIKSTPYIDYIDPQHNLQPKNNKHVSRYQNLDMTLSIENKKNINVFKQIMENNKENENDITYISSKKSNSKDKSINENKNNQNQTQE